MRSYKVREFADLSGVTVKALHHYDRLGLLRARRTDTGYRMYLDRDLERLEQIVALKLLGLPLRQIRDVLDRSPMSLPDALRTQRAALEEKRASLDRAVRAIRAAESALQSGKPAEPAILTRIIEAINMQDGIEAMKKYYSEDAWQVRKRYYEEGPSTEWQTLYRDVSARFGDDPSSPEAQAVADRWLALSIKAYSGDPAHQTDSPRAWMDREHWPEVMKERLAAFDVERVNEFVMQAVFSSRRKYFTPSAWTRFEALRRQLMMDELAEAASAAWQARVALFRDAEAWCGSDPAGAEAQRLAQRFLAQIDEASGWDMEVKDGLLEAWADRARWPATLRWLMEGMYMMTGERFDRIADFLDAAVAAAACSPGGAT